MLINPYLINYYTRFNLEYFYLLTETRRVVSFSRCWVSTVVYERCMLEFALSKLNTRNHKKTLQIEWFFVPLEDDHWKALNLVEGKYFEIVN